MKVIKKKHRLLGIEWEYTRSSESATWAAIIVGVVSAGVGIYTSSKTNKANKDAASQSNADATAARGAAQAELEKAQASYNALREERPGITFDDWKNEYVKSITDPVMAANFRKVKQDDFDAATNFAGQATAGNIRNFLAVRQGISMGKDDELTERSNEIALTADSPAAVKRAMELRSGYIPAGTVRYDSQGRLVEGQRSDKQVFTTAYEADLSARDRQFRMTRDLLSDYSNVADRQSEKAKDFLQFASLEPIARSFAEKAMQTSIDFQKQDEQGQMALIQQYAAAASGINPIQPNFQSTAASDRLTSEGISTAIKGIASYNNSNSGGGNSYKTSYTPSYGQSGYSTNPEIF